VSGPPFPSSLPASCPLTSRPWGGHASHYRAPALSADAALSPAVFLSTSVAPHCSSDGVLPACCCPCAPPSLPPLLLRISLSRYVNGISLVFSNAVPLLAASFPMPTSEFSSTRWLPPSPPLLRQHLQVQEALRHWCAAGMPLACRWAPAGNSSRAVCSLAEYAMMEQSRPRKLSCKS